MVNPYQNTQNNNYKDDHILISLSLMSSYTVYPIAMKLWRVAVHTSEKVSSGQEVVDGWVEGLGLRMNGHGCPLLGPFIAYLKWR